MIVNSWLYFKERHKDDPASIPIHHELIYIFLGEKATTKLAHVFDYPSNWSKILERTRPIKPKAELQEALRNMKSSAYQGQLLKFDGKRIVKARKSGLVIVTYNRKRESSVSVDGLPMIDVKRMKEGISQLKSIVKTPYIPPTGIYELEVRELRSHFATEAHKYPNYSPADLLRNWANIRKQQLTELIKATDPEGRLKQKYHESEGGRWFARGISLQAMPKLVLQTALYGCTEYDLHACQYVILEHIAKEAKSIHGKVIEHDAISEYVTNKEQVRQSLAERLGVTPSKAKSLIARLPCGGSIGGIEWDYDDIVTASTKAALYADQEYAQLHDQVQNVTRFMIGRKYSPVEKYNRVIVNARGLSMEIHRPSTERKAHILFGLEAQILESGTKAHTEGQDAPLVIKHDAWVTREEISVQDAIDAIRADTGIAVKFNRPARYAPSGLE